jgi:hypothetical protein
MVLLILFLAQTAEKSLELKKLIFPARKQRPAEARFMVRKIVFLNPDSYRDETTAGLASTNYL